MILHLKLGDFIFQFNLKIPNVLILLQLRNQCLLVMRIDYPIDGRFGKYGGKYIPETLVPAVEELESAYKRCKNDPAFQDELSYYLTNYAGRPTPLYLQRILVSTLEEQRSI